MSNSTNSTISQRSSFSIRYDEGAQLTLPERNHTIPQLERQTAEISPSSSRRVTFSEGPTIFGKNMTETTLSNSELPLQRQKGFLIKPKKWWDNIDIFMAIILVITLVLIILFATKTITMLSMAADIVIVSALAIGLILLKFYYNQSKKTIAGYMKKLKQKDV